ncbi:OmpA family protein [Aquihabitans sp. G128]|uniref:OmpA family protein n=1 Tax=Aquihabitans sp. G128 TaxID=2849779 RepID=UPI001C23B038|nr:OmpA family protein [Aquihabitans sp. G128]QXC60842.1 OmpA family protein [Aquihabitans sp. G128]
MTSARPTTARTGGAAAVVIATLLAIGVAGASAPASAQDPGAGAGRVVAIEHRTVDVIRRVESISGDIRTEETPKEVSITLAADVTFAFDKADLSPEAAARIDEVVAAYQDGGKGAVAIVGHTDSKGTAEYNADLSLRRATAVRDALAGKLPKATFTVAGKGAAEPVAPNTKDDGSDDPEGRARNRRVTITFARST